MTLLDLSTPLVLLLLGILLLAFIGSFGIAALTEWRRENIRRQAQQEEERQEKAKDREENERRLRLDLTMRDRENKIREKELAQEPVGPGTGGYIFVTMPPDKRSLFHDLLKGFEEYAQLKGYEISFSIDASDPDRLAFKFTILDNAVSVNPEKVKADFREYVEKVERGEPLDDLPVVISPKDHDLLLTILKNRINFLQHSHNLQKASAEFYEKLLQTVTGARLLAAPNVLVQTGGTMDSRSYKANNSSRFVQGDDNKFIDSSQNSAITIGNSFNERKERIEKVVRLIDALNSETNVDTSRKAEAIKNLGKVQVELADED
jgi:hypothetical protein